MSPNKLLTKILKSSKNIKFSDFVNLVIAFGFALDRTHGSHHIYKKSGVEELINLQNVDEKLSHTR